MANIKSQIKDIRQNEKRRKRNIALRSQVRTRTKKALTEGEAEADIDNLNLALKAIDKAVNKGVIHKNTGSRKKSLLMRSFAKNANTKP